MISWGDGGVGLHFAVDHQLGARTAAPARRPRTLSHSGWRVLPKLENDSMATRGLHVEAARLLRGAQMAISARSSAVGSMFTVASARK